MDRLGDQSRDPDLILAQHTMISRGHKRHITKTKLTSCHNVLYERLNVLDLSLLDILSQAYTASRNMEKTRTFDYVEFIFQMYVFHYEHFTG